MEIRLDRRDSIPLREWEEFLAAARRAGAADDAMVTDEVYHADPDVVLAYKVSVDWDKDSARGPANVLVPADILHDLLFVVRQVAGSDGDVRGLEESARRIMDTFSEHFLEPVLGPNPYADTEQEIAEAERPGRC